MCERINCTTLIKHNIWSCTYDIVCKELPYGVIEHHQLVVGINYSLPQEVNYRCILYLGIIFQAQILVVPNISQQLYQTLKMYFTNIWWNFAIFYTANYKSIPLYKKVNYWYFTSSVVNVVFSRKKFHLWITGRKFFLGEYHIMW